MFVGRIILQNNKTVSNTFSSFKDYNIPMCGRFSFISPAKLLQRYELDNLEARTILKNFEPDSNISPGLITPVITRNSPNQLTLMKWGLIPHWAKDPKIGYKTFNARSETLTTTPSFRESVKTKRCIVPADGFYEWKKLAETPKKSVPYYFSRKDGELISFAGLYDVWTDPEGHELKTFTIITIQANDLIKPIHDRMPVILEKDVEDVWLAKNSDINTILSLLIDKRTPLNLQTLTN
jgi:putative SOS response-associated peptidase YedK